MIEATIACVDPREGRVLFILDAPDNHGVIILSIVRDSDRRILGTARVRTDEFFGLLTNLLLEWTKTYGL